MATPPQKQPEFDAGHVPMSEEMDSMKRTLPPFLPILTAFIVLAAAVAIFFYFGKRPPAYHAEIVKTVAVPFHVESGPASSYGITELDVDKETRDLVIMLVQVQIKNTGRDPLYLKGISTILSTDKGDNEDLAAPESDYDRLFQAYPMLAAYRQPPIAPELKLEPGQETTGAELFGFQNSLKEFQSSKSLTLNISMYNHTITLPLQPAQIQVLMPPAPEHGKSHKK